MKENDILFYCDTGRIIKKNPYPLIFELINNKNKCFLVFNQEELQKYQTKGDVLHYFECSEDELNYKTNMGRSYNNKKHHK